MLLLLTPCCFCTFFPAAAVAESAGTVTIAINTTPNTITTSTLTSTFFLFFFYSSVHAITFNTAAPMTIPLKYFYQALFVFEKVFLFVKI